MQAGPIWQNIKIIYFDDDLMMNMNDHLSVELCAVINLYNLNKWVFWRDTVLVLWTNKTSNIKKLCILISANWDRRFDHRIRLAKKSYEDLKHPTAMRALNGGMLSVTWIAYVVWLYTSHVTRNWQ